MEGQIIIVEENVRVASRHEFFKTKYRGYTEMDRLIKHNVIIKLMITQINDKFTCNY